MVRVIALVLTALTGFSGLVYEVAWQRYLATLLGSHSEATSAVLGIFLGGLSVGYWLFGRVTRRAVEKAARAGRPPRLLLIYGLLEASIGVYVLAFPLLFRGVQVLSYALPHGASGFGFAIDVGLATLLIGPASVLMGGTIPLLTQSLARSLDDATRFHAFVYAFNTAGAFAGALAAGFVLVPLLGLESVMLAMGCVNLFAGAVFVAAGLRGREVVSLSQEAAPADLSQEAAPADLSQEPDAAPAKSSSGIEGFAFYAATALLTGFAMMTLQTTLIRIGVLAMGPSQFTFSMVVAVFVLAIALGSFAVSAFSRIPSWVVIANQWGIALLFLGLYPQMEDSPYFMLLVRVLFRDTDAGLYGFYGGALLVILAVIGPAVILSGASLPLLFHHMRREVSHLGDLAGYLYSWNTVGSLLGALVGGYALFFWLDLHQVYRIAVVALIAAAAILTVRIQGRLALTAGATVALLAAVVLLPAWQPHLLYSGLYRKAVADRFLGAGSLLVGHERFLQPFGGEHMPKILWHVDEPTASVVVREHERRSGGITRSIASNGKTDGDTAHDYGTTGLLALVPSLLAEKAERAFVVGWGLGSTPGELASFDSMREVDVAEISPGIIEAAPYFDFATENASRNPKIHVIATDAYRALMHSTGTYDLIISEPSQVWAAGVENLFSEEFLRATKSRLSPGGVYCQFMHRYEVDDESIALVLRTFAKVWDHVAVWHDVNRSLMLLGFNDPRLATDLVRIEQRARRPDFKATMDRMGIPDFASLLAYEIWPFEVLAAVDLPGPVQSLYHPRLNDVAGRAFFRGDEGNMPFSGYGEAAKTGAANSLYRKYEGLFRDGLDPPERSQAIAEACVALGARCNAMIAEWLSEEPTDTVMLDRLIEYVSAQRFGVPRERLADLRLLFRASPEELRAITPEVAARASSDFVEYYHHAAPFDPQQLLDIWSSCRESRPSRQSCEDTVRRAGADPRGLSFEERVQQCETSARIGHACQQGLNAARELVESGVLPEGPRDLSWTAAPQGM